jgi:putative transposase
MADYRRYYVPGGTVFFTLVTKGRARFLCEGAAPQILGQKMRDCRARWPFRVDAIVLLPDHLHCLWSLPPDDHDYSRRWAWIKKEFTKAYLAAGGREHAVSSARRRRGDRGVWQPRFWDHQIRDELDFERHFDYIHYNPVKHGLVARPRDWPFSSFHRWVAAGVYPVDWASGLAEPLRFDDLDETAME